MKLISGDTLAWLWRVTGNKKAYILVLTITQAVQGGIGVLYALLLRAIVDSAVAKDVDGFVRNVLLIIGLVAVRILIAAVIRWLTELSKSDIENTFKQRLVNNILQKDYAAVSGIHSAEWMNRLTNDAMVVANGEVEIIPGFTGTVVRMVSALVMIIALDHWFAYILIPGGIAFIILTYAFRGVLKRLHKNIQEKDGLLRIFLQERISSLIVIKAFTAENQTSEAAAQKMEDHKAARLRRNRFSNLANIGFSTAMQGMYLIGAIYCAHGILTDTVSYGTLVAIMQLIGQIQGPFANVTGYLSRWYAMTASAERLMEIEKYADDGDKLSISDVLKLYDRMISFGLENANFAYNADDQESVLRDVDLEIKRGEYVAFTGHSGCGKSTVLKLLMCMYSLNDGSRYIRTSAGREPLTTEHRRLFAYVPQGNMLMNGSIRDVVSFTDHSDHGDHGNHGDPSEREGVSAGTWDDCDDDKVRQALSIACADEFVDDMSAELGERGAGLSEGQMQRIAIARAIYSGSPVLLLDECTSALDEETEKKLLVNLKQLTDKTVVIVTHRKAALAICDREIAFAAE